MRAKTNYEFVRQTLRSEILEGVIEPGARLLQTELAKRLDVSTTPVREALQDLAREGLVLLDPHRGAVVRTLSLTEVREIYELRMVLEPMLLRKAVSELDSNDLDHARRLYERMETEQDVSRWAELNGEFHHTLFAPADGTRLGDIVASLRDSAIPYVALSLAKPDLRADSNAEHAELLAHLRDGDLDAAQRLTRDHLAATIHAIEESHSALP